MSTKLIEIESKDVYKNPKVIKARSFFGGVNRGMMLDITLEHLSGNKAHMEIELDQKQAIAFAQAILDKFSPQ